MISILFIGDGPRDGVVLPRLVERVLQVEIKATFHPWKEIRLNRGKGFGRKLQFATRQAQDLNLDAVVAVVDADNDRDGRRLRDLREARDSDRLKNLPFPTALGQSIPHGEVWLLDDPDAIRAALQLVADHEVPNIRRVKEPKSALEALIADSERAGEDVLILFEELARLLDPTRCRHAGETGFERFVEDMRTELGPLLEEAEQ